ERLTRQPLKGTGFTDKAIDLSKPLEVKGEPVYAHRFRDDQLDPKGKPYRYAVYAYRVRAVNTHGVEGGPPPYPLPIPPPPHYALNIQAAPQWLFSKEDGDSCHLKWSPNPEKGLKGYRVYRMESPRINGPGQKVTRVTDAPVADPKLSDEKIGKATRRYWVVAVDALGQEGFPSAPTWHYREYRRYYAPFVGEWHQ